MKKQFFYSMLAAAMLVSCSSEKVTENDPTNQYNIVEGQPAFINIGIAMPGDAGTRANDDFNDGAADEYAVKSGKLVLFKGTSEADATLFGAYDIPTSLAFNLEGTTTDQITSTSANYVQEISAPKLTGSQKLFAYVILNYNNNATGLTFSSGTTFSTFSTTVLKAIGLENEAAETKGYGAQNTTNGFVMTSVPVASKAGGSSDPSSATVTTLIPIDATAVYETQAAAEAGSANRACIYVERAAVKVEVKWGSALDDPAGGSAKVALVGWCLGNVNNGGSTGSGYYNTRQVETSWFPYYNALNTTASTKYRFVCGQPLFATDHYMGYRTYFGKDVNYNGTGSALTAAKVADAAHTLASSTATYTYENTFDEDHQKYNNTTYVSFKTTLNDGNDFWTIDGQRNTKLTATTLPNVLAANIDNDKSAEIATFKTQIETALTTDLGTTGGVLQTASFASTDVITFKLKHNITVATTADAAGHVTYSDKLSLDEVKVNGSDASSAQLTAIGNVIFSGSQKISEKLATELHDYIAYTVNVINKYTGGVAYYTTRIGHFWNAETPWGTATASYNNYDLIYPSSGVSNESPAKTYGASRAAAWLGRWGIVRNNWYVLSVDGISGIGDAVPQDYSGTSTGSLGETPDDNPEPKYYIKAHIHILPWVKRTQSVTL